MTYFDNTANRFMTKLDCILIHILIVDIHLILGMVSFKTEFNTDNLLLYTIQNTVFD